MSIKEYDNQPLKKLMNQRELIVSKLRCQGLRITKQRKLIMDIILDEDCTCCKEIYYQAHSRDSSIGIATVYRMIKTLEEIGAIDRRNMYKLACEEDTIHQKGCTVLFKNKDSIQLTSKEWREVLETGLKVKGFLAEAQVEAVLMK